MKRTLTKTRYYKGRARINLIKQHLPLIYLGISAIWKIITIRQKTTLGKVCWHLLCNYMLQCYMKLTLNNIVFRNHFFPPTFWLISITKTPTKFPFQYLVQQQRRWQDMFHSDFDSHRSTKLIISSMPLH